MVHRMQPLHTHQMSVVKEMLPTGEGVKRSWHHDPVRGHALPPAIAQLAVRLNSLKLLIFYHSDQQKWQFHLFNQ